MYTILYYIFCASESCWFIQDSKESWTEFSTQHGKWMGDKKTIKDKTKVEWLIHTKWYSGYLFGYSVQDVDKFIYIKKTN